MMTKTETRKPARMRGLVLAMALTATASGGLLTPNRADAYIASEVTQILNNISLMFSQFQHYYRYADDATKWTEQVRKMQQQIQSLAAIVGSFGMPASSVGRLEKANVNKLVRDRCGSGGSILQQLAGSFTFSPNADIAQQQTQICSAITTLEGYKYNESVDLINETLPEMLADLKRIEQNRNSNTENGGVTDGLAADVAAMNVKYQSEFDAWSTRTKVYDQAIDSLKTQQRSISQVALRGTRSSTAVGQIGKTLILKEALGQ